MYLDVVEHRLNVAKTLGADYTLKINCTDSDLDIVKRVHEILKCEPTVSIDCSGAEQAVRSAIQVYNVFSYRASGVQFAMVIFQT